MSTPTPPSHDHRGMLTAGVVGYLLGHRRPGGLLGGVETVAVVTVLVVVAVLLGPVLAVVTLATAAWPALIAVVAVVVGWWSRRRGLVRAAVYAVTGAVVVTVAGLAAGPFAALVVAVASLVVAHHRLRRL